MNNIKRFLSVLVAVTIVLSSLSFSFFIASAEPNRRIAGGTVKYDFDNSVPEYTVKKPYNMGDSKVSVVSEPSNSGNNVLEIKMIKNANKAIGVDLNYILESDTSYKISYRYKSDGNFNMPLEATTYYQSGFFPGTYENKGGAIADSANGVYKIAEKLTNFRDGTGNETISSTWTEVTRTFTTGTVDENKKYLSLAIHSAKNSSVEYASLYIDDIVIEKEEKLSSISFHPYLNGEATTDIELSEITGKPGDKVSLDRLEIVGYNLLGIYTDFSLTQEYTETEFTIGDQPTTYYVNYSKKVFREALYDFEDGKGYLDFGIQYNKNYADVAVVDDTQDNKCLKIYNEEVWEGLLVNFPFVLENNTSYRITYKIKSDEGAQVREDEGGAAVNGAAGIFVGKSTGITSTSGGKVEVKNYLKNKLAFLYDVPGKTGTSMYVDLPKEWTEQTWTFTTGENTVDDTFKHLAFNFYVTGKGVIPPQGGTKKYASLYLDDIKIEKISSIKFVAYEGDTESTSIKLATISGNPGDTRSLDCLSIAGYDVVGIYKDSSFNTPFTDDKFTVPDGSVTYYVKYAKNEKVYRFKFENSSDVKKTRDRAALIADPDGSGNTVLGFGKNWRESLVSFPYELKPNTSYALKLSYRSSSEGIVPRFYVYSVKDDDSLLDGSEGSTDYTDKRQFSIMDFLGSKSSNSIGSTVFDDNGEWITKEYTFTTNDEVDDTYKLFALGGKVQHTAENDSELLLVDNIEIKELDATVSFDVSFEGQKIDVANKYPSVGETITLPTKVAEPFKLEGWYYDKAFKNPVGSTLKVTKKNTVIYGKVSKNNKTKIDFETTGQAITGEGNWFCIGGSLCADPEDSSNRVLKLRTQGFNNYTRVRLNYQLRPNRIYNISVRYYGDNTPANMALVASKVAYPENGMCVVSGQSSNILSDSILPFVNMETIFSSWQTASLKITTDQPVIDDELKYLTVYYSTRTGNVSNGGVRETTHAYIDDIIIEDLGPFNPTDVEIESADKWTLPTEDASIWKDWSSWVTGQFENKPEENGAEENTDNAGEENYNSDVNSGEENNDFNDNSDYFEDTDFNNDWEDGFDTDIEAEDPPIQEETVNNQEPAKRKKIIKKVIVPEGSDTWRIIAIIVGVVVMVGAVGGIGSFLIIKKRRKSNS